MGVLPVKHGNSDKTATKNSMPIENSFQRCKINTEFFRKHRLGAPVPADLLDDTRERKLFRQREYGIGWEFIFTQKKKKKQQK